MVLFGPPLLFRPSIASRPFLLVLFRLAFPLSSLVLFLSSSVLSCYPVFFSFPSKCPLYPHLPHISSLPFHLFSRLSTASRARQPRSQRSMPRLLPPWDSPPSSLSLDPPNASSLSRFLSSTSFFFSLFPSSFPSMEYSLLLSPQIYHIKFFTFSSLSFFRLLLYPYSSYFFNR